MSYLIHERQWRVDKRVPLALLFACLLQVAAGLVWAAQLDTRVARIEKDIDHIAAKLDDILLRKR
jgi:hypothetical protein